MGSGSRPQPRAVSSLVCSGSPPSPVRRAAADPASSADPSSSSDPRSSVDPGIPAEPGTPAEPAPPAEPATPAGPRTSVASATLAVWDDPRDSTGSSAAAPARAPDP